MDAKALKFEFQRLRFFALSKNNYFCRLINEFMKKGILYALLASVLWSIVSPFIKQGISYDFAAINFAGMRFTLVGVILMIYTAHRGMFEQVRRNWRLFVLLILLNIFMGYVTFYLGVDRVSGDISSIVMGLTPLINVVLAHLLIQSDRLTRGKVFSLGVSLVGLLLIVGMGSEGNPLDARGFLGVGLLLASILLQGYSAILVSGHRGNIHGEVDPVFLNAVQMLFGGVMIYLTGVATEGFHPFWNKPMGFYLSLGVLVFISVFAFSFWFIALRQGDTKVSDVNMCRSVHPIIGAVASWILMPDEHPQFSTVAGMLLIFASLWLYFKGEAIGRGVQKLLRGK